MKANVSIPGSDPLAFKVHVRWPSGTTALTSKSNTDYLVTVFFRRTKSPYRRVAHCRFSRSSYDIEAGEYDGILEYEANSPFLDGVFFVQKSRSLVPGSSRYKTPRQRDNRARLDSRASIKVEYRTISNTVIDPMSTKLSSTELKHIEGCVEPIEKFSFDFIDWDLERPAPLQPRRPPRNNAQVEVVVPPVSSIIRKKPKLESSEHSTLIPPRFSQTQNSISRPPGVLLSPPASHSASFPRSASPSSPNSEPLLSEKHATASTIAFPAAIDRRYQASQTSTSRDQTAREPGHNLMRSRLGQHLKAENARLQERKLCLMQELDDLRQAEKEAKKEQREIEVLNAELEVLEAEVSAARKRMGL
ncbi:hypothetical protein BXZ70DRAFT_957389 [Cristinia sonorae]|uniref:Uncharacterized protein n=1 Tax=Cristinia sonorae TaxID=1940300 RepID=A0A8K0UGH6_9AGAR|nr:hypothetical protein BXZ70DRAFT_957389 [Cristinia sonorae]